jgi:hypothetical protein
MKNVVTLGCLVVFCCSAVRAETLVYHDIKTDAQGKILPWYSSDLGESYDCVIGKVWRFWKNMKPCSNGVPYYLQHQVSSSKCDPRGLGGDQISMALSSWNLLYAYSGDRSIVDNMILMADYWLDHGVSAKDAAWPNLPYPYNTEFHSGRYDGDMTAGKGYLQPDKAGSFGAELITLYKITGRARYLDAATAIANTLAAKVVPGDADRSPWPFRVHAGTGDIPTNVSGAYTSNWTGALRLFDGLIALNRGEVGRYQKAHDIASAWLKKYPMRTNKWGPFFEDVPQWSNTEINADTMAMYILEHPEWDPDWHRDARAILNWTQAEFGDKEWIRYGVAPIKEQTAYPIPGNSHTSRHASVELLYCERAGDVANKDAAIRQLNWATYMVADDGRNMYPSPADKEHWLTDGYGDYVRHYLRAMAAAPELAPKGRNHLLRSSSVIVEIRYGDTSIEYATFDAQSREKLRVAFVPGTVTAGGKPLARLARTVDLDQREGYVLETIDGAPGALQIRHDQSGKITVSR